MVIERLDVRFIRVFSMDCGEYVLASITRVAVERDQTVIRRRLDRSPSDDICRGVEAATGTRSLPYGARFPIAS